MFPLHFAPGITITQGGDSSCSIFCAYHNTIDISDIYPGTKYLYYGVLPDQGGACYGGCGASSSVFSNLCSVASHELIEAVTDPAVGVADSMASPLGWYDPVENGEIGDICNAKQGKIVGGDGITYTVQKQWSNAKQACIIDKTASEITSVSSTTTYSHRKAYTRKTNAARNT
ncbi:hypothetical protein HDU76_009767 [Blyttiomyces sp. JEL0837]|nr:hypothetical protein HDU76_009767 [Blyttiomyces sp. JEL0837]